MLDIVIDTRCHDLGGFEVGRVLPFRARRMVGPFIFFDRMGPAQMPPGIPRETDVRPHPHIGLSTITYLFEGEMTHRDSTGVEQVIRPGALNWMTAGRGISHSERFDGLRERGGPMDGIQAWVALPTEDEETAPDFAHHPAGALPEFGEGGLSARLIAGEAYGLRSPARTRSPLFYVHAELADGARMGLPEGHAERAVYVARGEVEVGGVRYPEGKMLVFRGGVAPTLTAVGATRLMLLGGEPVGARHIWWNFVSSRRDRIEQAKADWAAGRIPLPPMDRDTFIPLPEAQAQAPTPNPMS
ncbi:pirin family protein [Coralloluteibacterium thermophilus]|uniref:Pirin family protein n=1 Tax=Coralloluteibacterium thermophilum TaxID=2707049 RepID=A0ABV9NHV8_9GAMM